MNTQSTNAARLETHRNMRVELDWEIRQFEAALEGEADAFDTILSLAGPGADIDDLDAAERQELDLAEAAMAAYAVKRINACQRAAELAPQCVPVVLIHTLPAWLQISGFIPRD